MHGKAGFTIHSWLSELIHWDAMAYQAPNTFGWVGWVDTGDQDSYHVTFCSIQVHLQLLPVSLWSKSRYELSSPFRKNGDMLWQKTLAARISFQRFLVAKLSTGHRQSFLKDWKFGSHLVYMHTKLHLSYCTNICTCKHVLCTSVYRYTCSWHLSSLETLLPSNSFFSLGSFRWRRRSLGWCVSGRVQVAHCLAYQRLEEIS